jgi:hypothetical protein
MKTAFLILFVLFLTIAAQAQTNVRARYSKGQTCGGGQGRIDSHHHVTS